MAIHGGPRRRHGLPRFARNDAGVFCGLCKFHYVCIEMEIQYALPAEAGRRLFYKPGEAMCQHPLILIGTLAVFGPVAAPIPAFLPKAERSEAGAGAGIGQVVTNNDKAPAMNWIFLRGLTRETAHWGRFPDDFGQALPAARVISLDLPGNGQLHQIKSLLSVGSVVDFCRYELASRKVKPPYCLLAMSLGAMVATEWAYRFPKEIAGCVLINTSFQAFSPFYRRLRPGNYLTLLRIALISRLPADIEAALLKLTSNRIGGQQGTLAAWTDTRLRRPVSAGNALRQVMSAARYRARLEAPSVPLLILCSQRDRLVHVDCSLAIAAHWKCPLAVHASAGHDLPLDDADWVIEQVRIWLDEPVGKAGMRHTNDIART